MVGIVINDLNESRDLDREAMQAITGGAGGTPRLGLLPANPAGSLLDPPSTNVFDWANTGSGNP